MKANPGSDFIYVVDTRPRVHTHTQTQTQTNRHTFTSTNTNKQIHIHNLHVVPPTASRWLMPV